jgi:hypothetical protein
MLNDTFLFTIPETISADWLWEDGVVTIVIFPRLLDFIFASSGITPTASEDFLLLRYLFL